MMEYISNNTLLSAIVLFIGFVVIMVISIELPRVLTNIGVWMSMSEEERKNYAKNVKKKNFN